MCGVNDTLMNMKNRESYVQKFHEAFLRVHESNMSKLDTDGNPIYRDDGKVIKGPHYTAPDLSDLI